MPRKRLSCPTKSFIDWVSNLEANLEAFPTSVSGLRFSPTIAQHPHDSEDNGPPSMWLALLHHQSAWYSIKVYQVSPRAESGVLDQA